MIIYRTVMGSEGWYMDSGYNVGRICYGGSVLDSHITPVEAIVRVQQEYYEVTGLKPFRLVPPKVEEALSLPWAIDLGMHRECRHYAIEGEDGSFIRQVRKSKGCFTAYLPDAGKPQHFRRSR